MEKFKLNLEEITGTCAITQLKSNHLSYMMHENFLKFVTGNEKAIILVPKDFNSPEDDNIWKKVENPEFEFLMIHNNYLNKSTKLIHKSAIIENNVKMGKNISIGANSSIGMEGLRVIKNECGKNYTLRHKGNVILGDYVEIGSNSTIDRATFEKTIIGKYSKIGSNVHIAHNVKIGSNCIITAGVVIAGSVNIGDNIYIGIGAIIRNGLTIENSSFIGMGAVVFNNVKKNTKVAGNPARRYE